MQGATMTVWRTYKVTLPPEKAERLDQWCEDEGVTVSAVMEAWVDLLEERDRGRWPDDVRESEIVLPRARSIGKARRQR
jgi:hypothetical protein